MNCVSCGHEQASGNFCGKCGTPLQAVDKPQVEEVTVLQSAPETSAANVSESIAQPAPSQAMRVQPNREGNSWMKEFLHLTK